MNLKQFDLLQYTNTVVETINQILNERNWTLKKLSDVSNISYDTLKKLMSGHTGCPTTCLINSQTNTDDPEKAVFLFAVHYLYLSENAFKFQFQSK